MRNHLLRSCVIGSVLVMSGHSGGCEPGPAAAFAPEVAKSRPDEAPQPAAEAHAQANGSAPYGADRRKKRVERRAVGASVPARPMRLRPARRTQSNGVNTWLIFGFTEGADTGQKGERTAFHESVIRIARTMPGYAAWDGSWGVTYSTSDSVVVWGGGSAAVERNAAGIDSPVSTRGFGASAGLKYQLLQRNPSPIGLAVQLAPYWQRIEGSAIARETVGSEFRLLIDRALGSEQLFGAFNLAYQPERTTSSVSGVANRSNLEIAGAVTARILPRVFTGGELRYVNTYLGYFLNERLGWALFAGPTIYLAIGSSGYLGLAWSVQLLGQSAGDNVSGLDLVHFERHQLRLKLGFAF